MSQPRTLPRAALGVLLLAAGTSSLAASIDPVDRYAWGENIGWVNHRDASGAVQVYADHLEGFAWAENLGWVKLGSHSGGGTHSYGNGSASDWGVNNSSGTLSGYAWSENAGWVSFAPTGGGVTIANGIFDGYAWGENIGWVHFKNASPAYQVALEPVTLILGKTGTGDGTLSGGGSYAPGADVTLTATPNGTSTFAGWSPSPCAASLKMPYTDLTCTATFNLITRTLTVQAAGPGSGSVGGGGSYPPGAEVTATATPDAGSVLVGWTPAACAAPFALTVDTTCTATFGVACAQSWSQGAKAWKLVTLSCDPGPADTIAGIFGDDFGVPYYQDWALWAVDPVANTTPVFPTDAGQLRQGNGYWMQARAATTVDVAGSETLDLTIDAACPSAGGCFTVDLTPPEGSETQQNNLVGNPFAAAVAWADLRFVIPGTSCVLPTPCAPAAAQAANVASSTFWRYTGSAYLAQTGGTWQPNEGLFVRMLAGSKGKSGAQLWIPAPIPAPAMAAAPLAADALAAEAKAPPAKPGEWAVELTVSLPSAGLTDSGNWLGQKAGARPRADAYDLPELSAPPFGPYLSLLFPHAEWRLDDSDFSSDFHPRAGTDRWYFTIRQGSDAAALDLQEAAALGLPEAEALGDAIERDPLFASQDAPTDSALVLRWDGPEEALARSSLVNLTTGEVIPGTARAYVVPLGTLEPAFEWRYGRKR